MFYMYNQPLLDKLSFRPMRVAEHKEWHRMITGSFLHANMGHLIFNMIALFLFGRVLETILGSVEIWDLVLRLSFDCASFCIDSPS